MTARPADANAQEADRSGSREVEPDGVTRAAGPARGLLLPVVAAVCAAGVFWLVRGGLIDDAYITLSYARNVALHLHWGLNPVDVSNTATSPLNVLFLAGLTAVLRHPVIALGVSFVAEIVAIAWSLRRVTRALHIPEWAAWLGCALVLVNPLLLSSVGLEVTLSAALLCLLLAAAVEGRSWWFGVCTGLLLLTRVDLVIFALFLVVVRGIRRGWWKSVLTAAVVAVPWFAFSWVALGSAVPDTLIIKTLQKSWGAYDFGNGPWLYLDVYPVPTELAFGPALLGAVALLGLVAVRILVHGAESRRLTPVVLFGLGGVAHYAAYSKLGVPPYHWYYAPSITALSVVLALAAGVAVGRSVSVSRRTVAAVLAAAILLVVGVQSDQAVRHGLPWRAAPITTNWATPAEYAVIGRDVGRIVGTGRVQSPGEIGAIAYFCACEVVDAFADRGQLLPLIEQVKEQNTPTMRRVIDLNFRHLNNNLRPLPVDYALGHTMLRPSGGTYWPATTTWPQPATGYDVLTKAQR